MDNNNQNTTDPSVQNTPVTPATDAGMGGMGAPAPVQEPTPIPEPTLTSQAPAMPPIPDIPSMSSSTPAPAEPATPSIPAPTVQDPVGTTQVTEQTTNTASLTPEDMHEEVMAALDRIEAKLDEMDQKL